MVSSIETTSFSGKAPRKMLEIGSFDMTIATPAAKAVSETIHPFAPDA
jgi:hypothetical protein